MMENTRGGFSLSAQDARMEVTNAFFRKVYHWMTAGLILTALAAHAVASSETLSAMVYGSGMVFWVLILAELALVMGISAGIGRISAGTASLLFIVYSVLNGVTLSFVLMVYTGQSVFNAFLTTAGMFGVMSVYGLYTRRDLTSWGSFLTMGLIGLILASVVNLFMRSTRVEFVSSLLGVVIFMGLTAWDTQKLLRIGGELDDVEGDDGAHKLAIVGALALYLDFINLFLYLLRFFGRRSD